MRRLLALVFLLSLVLPGGALAHAQLRTSEPAEGVVVETAPEEIVLVFNEAVAPLVLRRIGPDGVARDVEGVAENETLTVRLPDAIEDGTHLLSWRVVSADGHPVGGTLTFHVGAASATAPAFAEPVGGAAQLVAALRFTLTLALVVAVGLAIYAALVERGRLGPGTLRIGRIAGILSFPVGAALLGIQGLDLLSLPPDALLTPAPWRAGLAASLAVTVLLSLCAVALSLVALQTRPGRVATIAALAAWGFAGLSFAASGHASTAPPRWLTAPAIAVHALALIYWLGSLLPLLAALRQPGAETALGRFSNFAVPLVALLLASGVALTWAQTGGELVTLIGSAYGAVLSAKLVLVLGLLVLAARNRLVLTPALVSGVRGAAPRLARAVRIEILIGLVILALASGFRLTPPPRALAIPAEPIYAHIHTDRVMADVTLTPGRTGPVTVELALQTGDFSELVPKEVEVDFAMPATGIEPIRIEAQLEPDGLWRAGPVSLTVPGEWEVSLRILITDFENVILRDTVKFDE